MNEGRHVCAFVSSREEEYAILAPFVKEGLEQGEKVSMIVNSERARDHESLLARSGIAVDGAKSRGQYATLGWEDAYLLDGYFDMHRMLALLDGAIKDRADKGYGRARMTGNMEWILKGAPGTEYALEYETRVNLVSPKHPDVFVCVYDINKFSAATLMDLMRTHPALIVGGVYHENPYFVPPERMLEELAQRGKAKTT